MNLFKSIRDLFGLTYQVENPVQDKLQELRLERTILSEEIQKSQAEFDETDLELNLKQQAATFLLSKGGEDAAFNLKAITERRDRIATTFLSDNSALLQKATILDDQISQVEADILAKAIELTASLPLEQQAEIKKAMVGWKQTGELNGEVVDHQVDAITACLEQVVKGGESSKDEKVLKESVSDDLEKAKNAAIIAANPSPSTGPGSRDVVRYDSPVAGHYANALVRKQEQDADGKQVEKILFLKRASTKTVEPGKYCLPGGHIEEGETIETAAERELKEEANLVGSGGYTLGKAKCANGKWAFYVEVYSTNPGALALLDGESVNACWMSRQEWLDADLFFDLKAHLVALTTYDRKIEDVRDIMKPLKKAEDDGDMLFPLLDEEELEKSGEGSRGGNVIGHTRSGKPIYIDHDHEAHKDFTSKDHFDAATFHNMHAFKQRAKNGDLATELKHRNSGTEHGKKITHYKNLDEDSQWSEIVSSDNHAREDIKKINRSKKKS